MLQAILDANPVAFLFGVAVGGVFFGVLCRETVHVKQAPREFYEGDALNLKEPQSSTIDHRALLKKYLSHVEEHEGTWFNPAHYPTAKFDDDEVHELQKLSKEKQ